MRQYKMLLGLILMLILFSGCSTRAGTTFVSSSTSLDATESAAYSFPSAENTKETTPQTKVTVPTIKNTPTSSTAEATTTTSVTKTTTAATAAQTKVSSPTAASTTTPTTVQESKVDATTSTSETTTVTTVALITSMPQEYLQAVCDGLNNARQNNGEWSTDVLVVLDAELCARAKDHAIAMANAGDIFHSDFAKAGHPESVTMYASSDGYLEGVAAGIHADNLLLPETVRLGVGAVKTSDGTIYLSVLGDR